MCVVSNRNKNKWQKPQHVDFLINWTKIALQDNSPLSAVITLNAVLETKKCFSHTNSFHTCRTLFNEFFVQTSWHGVHSAMQLVMNCGLSGPWLHFPFSWFFLWGIQKGKEISMFHMFLFSCFFPSVTSSFGKCEWEHQIWGKVKQKEKLAKILLFAVESQTLIKVFSQHQTVANCCF